MIDRADRTDCSKILHVVQSLNFGGVESHMKIIALNAGSSIFEHHICVMSNGGVIADELIATAKPITVLSRHSLISSLSTILALVRHIKAERPAILHCHQAEANFYGLIAGTHCSVRVCIAEEIRFPNHSCMAQLIFRLVYRLADCVVAISQAVKCKLISVHEIDGLAILDFKHLKPQKTLCDYWAHVRLRVKLILGIS
jgi:hypothetical protein